jgi:hypothetical protein
MSGFVFGMERKMGWPNSPEKRLCVDDDADFSHTESYSDDDSIRSGASSSEDLSSNYPVLKAFECRYFGHNFCRLSFNNWKEEVDHCAEYHDTIASDEIAFE